ncbi:MAG: type II toxin-antitoxin system VapC family toxin [Candidatus Limnocylindrales bacterium]
MRFWDTSALVPLLLREPLSSNARGWLAADPVISVWWSTPIECLSAIARAERDGRIQPAVVPDAIAALRLLRSGWSEVDATSRLRDIAERLVRTHPLRAADACQLAAAIVAAEGAPSALPFVTLDMRLADAADREGFEIIGCRA